MAGAGDGRQRAVFLGDDVTDEDGVRRRRGAWRRGRADRRAAATAAAYRLNDVAATSRLARSRMLETR